VCVLWCRDAVIRESVCDCPTLSAASRAPAVHPPAALFAECSHLILPWSIAQSFFSASPTFLWDCMDRPTCINGRPVLWAASLVANVVHAGLQLADDPVEEGVLR
jgi:hypothetical protein